MYHANVNVNSIGENVNQIKIGITTNVDVSVKIWKNINMCIKDYFWNPATRSCENSKYLASIIDNSVIWWHEIMEETKIVPANFNE